MIVQSHTAYTLTLIHQLIAADLREAADDDDLRHRLAARGYGFRDTEAGRVLTTLPHGVVLGRLR
jgi:hypothetical protein